jgi:DNA-directed RNA polymerase
MDSMKSFLRRDNELTILSTPLPEGTSSNGSAIPDSDVFHDTHTQDKVAVIDACMHAQADVPRAKAIFDKLRDDRPTDPQLGVGLYNKMIHGYVKMAEKEQANRVYWVDEAWSLYSFMQENPQVVKPTAGIYSVMLQAWMK